MIQSVTTQLQKYTGLFFSLVYNTHYSVFKDIRHTQNSGLDLIMPRKETRPCRETGRPE